MKTPWWEASPGATAALINTGEFVYATLYTITLAGSGDVLRYADSDMSVTNGTYVWDNALPVDREKSKNLAHWKRGLDVDTWRLVVLPRNVDVAGNAFPDTINGISWLQAARSGVLSGADVQVDRAYFAAWPQPYALKATPVGIITVFAGRPAEIDCNDTAVVVNLNDYRSLLSMRIPRNPYQAGCRNTLFDAGCTLVAASFAVPGSAIGGSTVRTIKSAPLVPGGSGTFQLGRITMTSGENDGFSRTVRRWTSTDPGSFELLNPFPFDVVPGDTFDAYPGCDKTTATCTLFANLVNYGPGTPFVPQAEAAL